ncbi:hypothetical protein [Parvibaculum sp. MBR-TMA-1.3b-4.2]
MMQTLDPSPLAETTSVSPVTLESLAGVWKRTLLVEADGSRDDTSTVYWLQLGSICGDIRLTADRAANGTSAFAGSLSERDGIFRWSPEIAQGIPADADPDEGTLKWEGGILREDGVRRPYLEHWQCAATPSPEDYALRFHDDRECLDGYLIRIADFGFYACRPRSGASPCFALLRATAKGWAVAEALSETLHPGQPFVWPEIARTIASAPGLAGCKFGESSVVTFERMPVRNEVAP